MGYSNDDSQVRVDFFKESGKWYATESIIMRGRYWRKSLHGALKQSLNEQLHFSGSAREGLRYGGMTAVCLEPYHVHAHPIMLKLPVDGFFVLDEFETSDIPQNQRPVASGTP